jgi:hypothetical protein
VYLCVIDLFFRLWRRRRCAGDFEFLLATIELVDRFIRILHNISDGFLHFFKFSPRSKRYGQSTRFVVRHEKGHKTRGVEHLSSLKMIQRKHSNEESKAYTYVLKFQMFRSSSQQVTPSKTAANAIKMRQKEGSDDGTGQHFIALRHSSWFSLPHYWLCLRDTMSFYLLSGNKKIPVRNFMKVVAINFYFLDVLFVLPGWIVLVCNLHFPFESNVSFILCWWQHLIPHSLLTWTIACSNGRRRLADSLRLI